MSEMERPAVFYLSVHSDPLVYVAPYKKVVAKHSLYQQNARGRRAGNTYTAAQVIQKISTALLDCGAIPSCGSLLRAPHSGRPMSFFVTQLDEYWRDAIIDLATVGVRIYVVPVVGAIEGMPDGIADAFSEYFDSRFADCYAEAARGVDAMPLIEIATAVAALYEPVGLSLTPKHRELITKTQERVAFMRTQAAKTVSTLGLSPKPAADTPDEQPPAPSATDVPVLVVVDDF